MVSELGVIVLRKRERERAKGLIITKGVKNSYRVQSRTTGCSTDR